MTMLWLWVLIGGLVGWLALTGWGLWWLWHKAVAVGQELERLLGRLDELGGILGKVDMTPLEEGRSEPWPEARRGSLIDDTKPR